MSVLLAETVEPRRHRGLQPVHPFAQVRLRGFQGQMKMVSHQHVSVHTPVELVRRLKQHPQECLCRPDALEQITPVVPSIDHMMQRPGVLDP